MQTSPSSPPTYFPNTAALNAPVNSFKLFATGANSPIILLWAPFTSVSPIAVIIACAITKSDTKENVLSSFARPIDRD